MLSAVSNAELPDHMLKKNILNKINGEFNFGCPESVQIMERLHMQHFFLMNIRKIQ